MKRIILVTGGQRSGKSTFAEKMVLDMAAERGTGAFANDDRAVYMATSRIWDEEFAHRVKLHQQRRGERWINLEEPKFLSKHNVEGRVVLIDCVTLWSTNFFFDMSTMEGNGVVEHDTGDGHNVSATTEIASGRETMKADQAQESAGLIERVLSEIKEEFQRFTSQDAVFVFVTNEIGLCGVPENKIQRQFTDLLGWLNQYIASVADEVFFMVSGIPMKIK